MSIFDRDLFYLIALLILGLAWGVSGCAREKLKRILDSCGIRALQ